MTRTGVAGRFRKEGAVSARLCGHIKEPKPYISTRDQASFRVGTRELELAFDKGDPMVLRARKE
jgi:hypothetical protein